MNACTGCRNWNPETETCMNRNASAEAKVTGDCYDPYLTRKQERTVAQNLLVNASKRMKAQAEADARYADAVAMDRWTTATQDEATMWGIVC